MSNWRLNRSIDCVWPQRRKMSLWSRGTRAAAAARGSMCCTSLRLLQQSGRSSFLIKSPTKSTSCVSTSALLHLRKSGAFAAFTSRFSFFRILSVSRRGEECQWVCIFMLIHIFSSSPRQSEMYLHFPGWTKWNVSTFSWFPKVLSTGMREQTQLSRIAGRAVLCSDPNVDKRPVKGLLFLQQGADTGKNAGYCALMELIYY